MKDMLKALCISAMIVGCGSGADNGNGMVTKTYEQCVMQCPAQEGPERSRCTCMCYKDTQPQGNGIICQ